MVLDTEELRKYAMLRGWRAFAARWLVRDLLMLAAKEIDRLRADNERLRKEQGK